MYDQGHQSQPYDLHTSDRHPTASAGCQEPTLANLMRWRSAIGAVGPAVHVARVIIWRAFSSKLLIRSNDFAVDSLQLGPLDSFVRPVSSGVIPVHLSVQAHAGYKSCLPKPLLDRLVGLLQLGHLLGDEVSNLLQ